MSAAIKSAIPVLPASDVEQSLKWWTEICGFSETFRDATPPSYAGLSCGDAHLHIAGMDDKALARTVADQTMVRFRCGHRQTVRRISEPRRQGASQRPATDEAVGY